MSATAVLIHSPLVGPTTWSPVARELERRARAVVAPSLLGVADVPPPQWRHCVSRPSKPAPLASQSRCPCRPQWCRPPAAVVESDGSLGASGTSQPSFEWTPDPGSRSLQETCGYGEFGNPGDAAWPRAFSACTRPPTPGPLKRTGRASRGMPRPAPRSRPPSRRARPVARWPRIGASRGRRPLHRRRSASRRATRAPVRRPAGPT
jgi:hypothetical protein